MLSDTNVRCMPLPRFHPAALRWFPWAETQRRPVLWCMRSPYQSRPCSPARRTSSPSPPKCWGKERCGGKVLITVAVEMCLTASLPFHGYFPFARLSGTHVVKAASVVVWVGAPEHQLPSRGMFWIPERNYSSGHSSESVFFSDFSTWWDVYQKAVIPTGWNQQYLRENSQEGYLDPRRNK